MSDNSLLGPCRCDLRGAALHSRWLCGSWQENMAAGELLTNCTAFSICLTIQIMCVKSETVVWWWTSGNHSEYGRCRRYCWCSSWWVVKWCLWQEKNNTIRRCSVLLWCNNHGNISSSLGDYNRKNISWSWSRYGFHDLPTLHLGSFSR